MRAAGVLVLGCLALAACGSSSPQGITVGAARTFQLAGFEPKGTVSAGRPTTLGFTIDQPSGAPLTKYKTGTGPHTGVHVIVVRDDLSTIIHRHPPIAADGHVQESITFPQPGPYRVLVDAYPELNGPLGNFQLFRTVHVGGAFHPRALPPFRTTVIVDGYRVTMRVPRQLRAIQADHLSVTVTDSSGTPVRFTPWYGALAHAIFFKRGSLSYFHTHVCGPATPGCTSTLGGARIVGHSTKPGRLSVGVLLPVAGTWRLFLQFKAGGRVLTAPYTLQVR